jgi:hypothetical protein
MYIAIVLDLMQGTPEKHARVLGLYESKSAALDVVLEAYTEIYVADKVKRKMRSKSNTKSVDELKEQTEAKLDTKLDGMDTTKSLVYLEELLEDNFAHLVKPIAVPK